MTVEQIFDKVYKRYYRKCVLFAKSYTHDISQAEDIVADAMIVLLEKLRQDQDIDNTLPFLFGIIRNKILQHFRREEFKMRMFEHISSETMRELQLRISLLEECDPKHLYHTDVKAIVRQSLASMSKTTRTTFILSRFANKSNKEIAQHLGIGVKSVEYHITKALKKLRSDLKDFYPLFQLIVG